MTLSHVHSMVLCKIYKIFMNPPQVSAGDFLRQCIYGKFKSGRVTPTAQGYKKATAFIEINLQSLFLEEFIKVALENFG